MTQEGTSNAGFAGQKSPSDTSSDFNVQSFLIKQLLGRLRTIGIGKVINVTNADVVDTPPTVDVQPVINMLDGNNNSTQHGIIYGLPYFRLQGGANSVLTPPAAGDFVVTLTADRDISAFKKAPGIVNPGSLRRFDLADGIAIGGIGNGAPTQYLRFKLDSDGNPSGFIIVDPFGNTIETSADGLVLTDKFGHVINMGSGGITITGDVTITGKLTSTDTTSLGGGSQAVKLADGSNATKVKAT